MNHGHNRSLQTLQRGFTLVELLLAMSFVSLLLMAITLTVIQISNIYTKGITLRAVDQVGQAVSQDIRRSIEAARPIDVGTTAAGGMNYRPSVAVGGDINDPDGGRLCTGSYSYIWNNGKALTNPVNKYDSSSDTIRLVKVPDNGALYCSDPARPVDHTTAVEMLSAGDRELAVQSFAIEAVSKNADLQQELYQISLEIGTNDQEALSRSQGISSIDTSCRPPSEEANLKDYCAVNKFEFTARAGNTGGGR
jgi:prepilin-type N-terminal cleavage/methylation domain-containing protein